jgi:hypothetical protein
VLTLKQWERVKDTKQNLILTVGGGGIYMKKKKKTYFYELETIL